MTNLNTNEFNVLIGIGQSINDCTGGQFGYAEDIPIVKSVSKPQLSGYISQLVQKGYIVKDNEFGSLQLTEIGAEMLKTVPCFSQVSFETV